MATTPETENQLLRSVLSSVAEGRADAAQVAFALDNPGEAQKALEAYQLAQSYVIDEVRAFLQGGGEDTGPLEKRFDALMRMRGLDSHRRNSLRDARGPRKRR